MMIYCPHGYPINVEHGWDEGDKRYTCTGGQVVGYRPLFVRLTLWRRLVRRFGR